MLGLKLIHVSKRGPWLIISSATAHDFVAGSLFGLWACGNDAVTAALDGGLLRRVSFALVFRVRPASE